MKLYAEISKTEELDDGTIKVWGYASSEAVDSDGETITAEAMKAALPDYLKFGAVREMHGSNAAGTAIEASVGDDGRTFFGAHVVDPVAVKKVNAGVYKGFSIGGKITGRDDVNKTIITGLKLVEVSLVDRPANPDAVFTMYKAESIDEPVPAIDALAELLNKGAISAERLLELAKAEELAKEAESVEKGMYSVSNFADILASLSYLVSDAEWESQYEGDKSPIPQSMRDWLAQGVAIFTAMAAEETSEMLTALQAMAPAVVEVEVVEQSAKTDDLIKMTGELDIAKADLAKVAEERDALFKRVKELEAMPAPGKALLKAVSITKAQDSIAENTASDTPTEIRKADGTIDRDKTATLLIKQAHKTPMRFSL